MYMCCQDCCNLAFHILGNSIFVLVVHTQSVPCYLITHSIYNSSLRFSLFTLRLHHITTPTIEHYYFIIGRSVTIKQLLINHPQMSNGNRSRNSTIIPSKLDHRLTTFYIYSRQFKIVPISQVQINAYWLKHDLYKPLNDFNTIDVHSFRKSLKLF